MRTINARHVVPLVLAASSTRRCAPPRALHYAQPIFEAQADPTAALGCAVSLAPVVLALHWGMELTAAADGLRAANRTLWQEKLACLRGEGCPIAYEAAEVAATEAKERLERAKPFHVAGATQQLVGELLEQSGGSLAAVQRQLKRRGLEQLRPTLRARRDVGVAMTEDTEAQDAGGEADKESGAQSLEEKMAAWEATEEEQRANTLGGNIPLIGMPGLPGRMTRTDQPDKMDGFDVGMNISGLILFPLAILILTVPFWIGSIDVSDVGPPPTS